MAKFHVGQAVRIARNFGETVFDVTIGRESVVTETNVTPVNPLLQQHFQAAGCPALVRLRDFPPHWLFAEDELEPIVPPGLESYEEITQLYTPDICEVDIT